MLDTLIEHLYDSITPFRPEGDPVAQQQQSSDSGYPDDPMFTDPDFDHEAHAAAQMSTPTARHRPNEPDPTCPDGASDNPFAGTLAPDPTIGELVDDAATSAGADRIAAQARARYPGPETALMLTALTGAPLSPAGLVDAVCAAERLASWTQATQHRYIAAFARPGTVAPLDDLNRYAHAPGQPLHPGHQPTAAAATGGGGGGGGAAGGPAETDLECSGPRVFGAPHSTALLTATAVKVAAAEISAALQVSPINANRRVAQAVEFVDDLPATLDELRTGRIDRGRAMVIADRTQNLPTDLRHRVEALIVPKTRTRTAGQVRGIADRAVIAADPDAARKRHETARKLRGIGLRAGQDGMSLFRADVTADKAGTAFAVLDQLARIGSRNHTETRGIGALRADAFTDIFDQLADHGTVHLHTILHNHHTTSTTAETGRAASGADKDTATGDTTTGDTSGPTEADTATSGTATAGDISGDGPDDYCTDKDDAHDATGGDRPANTTDDDTWGATPGHSNAPTETAGHDSTTTTDTAGQHPAGQHTAGQHTAGQDTAAVTSARSDTAPLTSADGDTTDPAQDQREHPDIDNAGGPVTPPPAGSIPVDATPARQSSPPQGHGRPDTAGTYQPPGTTPARTASPFWGLGTHQGRTTGLNVTIAATTLAGLDDLPGELDGHGPILADLARAIATSAATITAIAVNPCGTALDLGRTTYRPRLAQRDHVINRDQTCRFPSCRQPARRCQIDHSNEYCPDQTSGGTTCPCNLACLCKFHHDLKTFGIWDTHHNPDNSITWTSTGTGRTYITHTREWLTGMPAEVAAEPVQRSSPVRPAADCSAAPVTEEPPF